MRRMFRYTVPVDDQVHAIELRACPHTWPTAGLWMKWSSGLSTMTSGSAEWRFRVFGTGYQLPEKAVYIGTAPRTPEGLVWTYALTHEPV